MFTFVMAAARVGSAVGGTRRVGQTVRVKRLTAVRHLTEMAGVASEMLRLRASDLGWPLEELWVSGALLAAGEDLESASVVVMLDLPADELPWLAVNPSAEWIGDQLRLGKRPIEWCYRPAGCPGAVLGSDLAGRQPLDRNTRGSSLAGRHRARRDRGRAQRENGLTDRQSGFRPPSR
jgi:hypothetical protein